MFLLIFYRGCFTRERSIEVMRMDIKKIISSYQPDDTTAQEEQGFLHRHYK